MRIKKKYIMLMVFITCTVISQEKETIDNHSAEDPKTVYFTNVLFGSAFDESGNVIYRTSDGGKNWLNYIVPEEDQIRQIIIEGGKNKENINSKKNKKPVSGGYGDDLSNGFMPADDHLQNKSSLAEIRFTLNKPGFVSIKIYNSAGSTIDELARSSFGAGFHEIKWNSSKFQSDVYYYSIVSNEFSETNKIIKAK